MRNDNTLIDKVSRKELGLHQIDLPASEAVEIRRKAVEKLTGATLDALGAYVIDADVLLET